MDPTNINSIPIDLLFPITSFVMSVYNHWGFFLTHVAPSTTKISNYNDCVPDRKDEQP